MMCAADPVVFKTAPAGMCTHEAGSKAVVSLNKATQPPIRAVASVQAKPVVPTKVMYDPPPFPGKLTEDYLNTWSYRCAAGQVRGGATFCSQIGAAESAG